MTGIAKKCAQACGIEVNDHGLHTYIADEKGQSSMVWSPETNPAQAWIVESELIRRVTTIEWGPDGHLTVWRGPYVKGYDFTTDAERMSAVCQAMADLMGETG